MRPQTRFIKSDYDLLPVLVSLFERKSAMVSALVVHTVVVGSLWLLLFVDIAASTQGSTLR